jgi:hypothetical protein
MATIHDLVLTVSRDSEDRVGIKVTYAVDFTSLEQSVKVVFDENVVLYESVGQEDAFEIMVADWIVPTAWVRNRWAKGAPDLPIANLYQGTLTASKSGSANRTVERWLTPAELSKLRQSGREHPVVVVEVLPQNVTPDIDVAHVDIDVGDPGEGTT